MIRAALALVLALALAACGGGGGGGETGTAELWVTRDRGSEVVLTATVAAGDTALQALSRVAEVETRHGGRFVHSIEGLEGSLAEQRDWFYFVNGIEADRSAAEYRLRPGEVVWFDLRSWRERMEEPVVVGAFPQPFLDGYDGTVHEAVVVYASPALEPAARELAEVVGAASVVAGEDEVPEDANLLVVAPARGGGSRLSASLRDPGRGTASPVEFVVEGGAAELARDPARARFLYAGELE